jgi:TRAP-type C4-dicarboxylate transport system substrate-binding protein
MAELRTGRYWHYELDEVIGTQLSLMGVHMVPLPIVGAGPAFDEGRVDGFFSVPYAAVVYRYGVKSRYFTDLSSMFLPGCVIVLRSAMAELTADEQRTLRDAGARLEARFAKIGKQQDEEVLSRVLPQQGLRAVPMSPAFRRQYLSAARAAGARLGPRLVPLTLVRRVSAIVEETRTPHARTE